MRQAPPEPLARAADEQAARDLLVSTEALDRALADELGDLAAAVTARDEAFAALHASLRGPLSPAACAAVERVVEIDRGILARAEEQLSAVRAELARGRQSRDALRSLESEKEPPRFFSERA